MATYDGSIKIKTDITTKQAEIQLTTLQNRIVKTVDKIESLRSKMDSLKDAKIPTQAYKDLEKELSLATKEMENMLAQDNKFADIDAKIEKLSKSATEYAEKMKEVAEQKIPTESYASVEKQIAKTEKVLSNLVKKQEKFLADGGKESSDKYKKMARDAEDLEQKLQNLLNEQEKLENIGLAYKSSTDTEQYKNISAKYEQVNQELEKQKGLHSEIAQKQGEAVQRVVELKSKMEQLVQEGKAFTLGSETEEFANTVQQLQYVDNEMDELLQKEELQKLKLEEAREGYEKLGNTAKKSLEKISKSQNKATDLLSSFIKRLKSIISTVFIFNLIRKALNSVISGIKEGFQNLYNDNEKFKSSVNSLKASLTTFKNSLAAAFAPIVEIAVPYIEKLISYMTQLVNMVGQFIAAITGQKTYTKAIKQTTEAIENETKASNKQLSSLDKLNNLSSGSQSDTDTGTGTMFEEVPIDSGILDFLQKMKDFLQPIIDYANKLKDIFLQGFWDGLGDWEYRWQSIKDSIASIKESLIDIFTDPAVVAAADAWAQSVAYMLGSLVGSLASIGLSIATNLLGGIAKYLEQNKDRIKNYLINMFNIWEEVNYLFASLFQSIAYVFEAFASEDGQQLTANIIGIFVDTFMGITELASKLFRDIASIIIKPFVDNKEGFRTALEGFLSVLAEVTGTIKQGIDDTFDKLNEVYDEHFKPFFDSVAQGLSDLVGKFLDFWNGSVQPILEDWAAKFDTLWKEHIQPFLDNVAELLGSLMDLLKTLWEQALEPFIGWIIDNVLPKVLPILQEIYDTVVTVVGDIADFLSGFIGTVTEIINLLVALINGDWDAAWEAAKGIVENVFNMIFSFIKTIWDSIIGAIDVALESIFGIIETVFKSIYDSICKVWNDIKEYTTSFFSWIKENIDTVMSDIKGIWDKAWNAFFNTVSNVLSNIKSTIKSAFDWISAKVDSIKEKLSGITSGIRGVSSSYSVPSPGTSRSSMAVATLSNMEIPAYATGQVIPRAMKQHLAILGDNNRETEVVSPLSTMKQAFIESLVEAGITGSNGDSGEITINIPVTIDGREVFRVMQKQAREYKKQTGSPAFS